MKRQGNWSRALGLMLVLASCKGEGCGVHWEVGGPRVRTERALRTQGSATPVPAAKLDYVGVWWAAVMRLAIRDDGGVVYYRNDGSGPVSIDSTITAFHADGFSAGAEPWVTSFHVQKPPHLEGAEWKMSVDGVELLKIPDYGDLAHKLLAGARAPADESKAAELAEKGCEKDDMRCCGLLGTMVEHGNGVQQDFVRAARLLTKACAREELLSCAVLGGYYSKGQGVAVDLTKSLELVSKACSGGERMGCYNLAVMYDEGTGVAKDDAKAAELYTGACERGSAAACLNLGIMHEDGEGVPKSSLRAGELYERACRLGLTNACRAAEQP